MACGAERPPPAGACTNCGSRQLRCGPTWSTPQEMLQQSDSPSKIITGCSETGEHKRSSFQQARDLSCVCVCLHLTWCVCFVCLLCCSSISGKSRCEGFLGTERQAFQLLQNADTNPAQLQRHRRQMPLKLLNSRKRDALWGRCLHTCFK